MQKHSRQIKNAGQEKRKEKAGLGRPAVAAVAAAGLFVVFFLLAEILLPDRSFSPNENRNLAERPGISGNSLKDGSFFSELSSYFSDQFFLRDAFVGLSASEEFLLGRRESHGVYIGKDHYLFAAPETPVPEKIRALTDAVGGFAASYPDRSIRMMVVPCAASVIPEKLPANAPVRNQLQDISDFASGLPASVTFIDTAQILREHAADQLYYRTDHHWTSLGAKTVFEGTAAQLGIEAPMTEYDHLLLSTQFLGTLGSQSGHYGTRDRIDLYIPKPGALYYVSVPDENVVRSSLYDREKLSGKDQYQVFLGGNHPVVEIRTAAGTDKNLLLFKDSYANSFVQFLIPYYDKIVMIDPRYYYDSLETVIRSNGITDILFLYSANTLFTDNSLTDCLNNASSGEAAQEPASEASQEEASEEAQEEISEEAQEET